MRAGVVAVLAVVVLAIPATGTSVVRPVSLTSPVDAGHQAANLAPKALKRVWVSGGRIHAKFRLPPRIVPYLLRFKGDWWALLIPGQDPRYADGTTTSTTWTSTRLFASITDEGPQSVILYFGPRSTCATGDRSINDVRRCRPRYVSAPVKFYLGDVSGPGALIGSSTARGEYAIASVSGTVRRPRSLTVRVSSTPSRQRVNIAWDVTCSKGSAVQGRSGTFDGTTPVDDGYSIRLPFTLALFSAPDSCIYAVSASLEGRGSLTLRLFARIQS